MPNRRPGCTYGCDILGTLKMHVDDDNDDEHRPRDSVVLNSNPLVLYCNFKVFSQITFIVPPSLGRGH